MSEGAKRDTALRRYQVPSVNGLEGWGIFVIGMDGYFSVISDFGSYAYPWWHHGEKDFRNFLIHLTRSPDYVCSKLGRKDMYDPEGTIKHIRQTILETRRSRSWTKERARKEWDLLADCDGLQCREDFGSWYSQTSLGDAYEYMTEVYPWDLQNFTKKLWPRFAALLRAELDEEARQHAPAVSA